MNYVHNLDPFAIEFYEGFGIRWYGLAYLAGFIAGYYVIHYLAKKRVTPILPDKVSDFITLVAVGVLAGGRVGYCLFYAPELLIDFSAHFPFWGVLRVNEGGMSSHGGILGVMLVCALYARKHKMPIMHVFDLVTFGGSVGFFFGRLANFINGELYGREASKGFPFTVQFPNEMYTWGVEKLKTLTGAVETLGASDAATWQGWLANYGVDHGSRNAVHKVVDQLVLATQHGNEAVTQALSLVLTPRYPSQLIQAVLEGLLVFVILAWMWRKPQKVGVISGWYGVLYCVARIAGEQFRMPDAHIGFQLFGLTRGQWLSVALLLIAIAYLTVAYRRPTPRVGGWKEAQPLRPTK